MLAFRTPNRPSWGAVTRPRARALRVQATAAPEADFCTIEEYREPPISPEKRQTLNLLLAAAVTLPTAGLLGPYAASFVPRSSGGAGGPQAAADALGADVHASAWLAAHQPGDRSLVQGLKGDPTYLVVGEMGLEKYGVNSICTHLGCVVPWNAAELKFMCPCHGSQYDAQGKKVRGPAPLSLSLAHADVDERDVVMLSPWTDIDFRDGSEPWWT
ncbi:hypothetical protein ABPG75_011628 [Micractinium tetrahymenae]